MIEIPRSLLRQFGLALKRSFPPRCRPLQPQWVVIEANQDKLLIEAQHPDAGISFQFTGQHAPGSDLPSGPRTRRNAGPQGSVTLERQGEKIVARFDDAGIPRGVEYDTTDPAPLPPFPCRRLRLPKPTQLPRLWMTPCNPRQ